MNGLRGTRSGLFWFSGIVQDLRYAVRGLRRSPGFAVTAIATLAIGLGVNAAVFSVTNAVLFKGFPLVQGNDRLLYIAAGKRGMTARVQGGVSYPDFEDWQAQAKSFEGMALVRGERKILSGAGDSSEGYLATTVTANTFQLLGVKPILGRSFTPADAQSSAPPVVILRYRTWERRFGKDPDIVGRTVRLSGVPATVIGVMPREFSFPYNQDLWMPLVPRTDLKRSDRNTFRFAIGRLAGGATIQSARTEMETIGGRLANAYPDTNQDIVPWVGDFNDYFTGAGAARAYEALWVAAGFVLLIACANVANLLLGRAMGRSREIGIRNALGAGRSRILRQLLVESLLLSSLGGLLGWWIAQASVRIYALTQGSNDWAAQVLGFTMDYRVLAYLVALTLGTGLLFGFAPALRLSAPLRSLPRRPCCLAPPR